MATKGPGDAHGTKESVWRRDRYEVLFPPKTRNPLTATVFTRR